MGSYKSDIPSSLLDIIFTELMMKLVLLVSVMATFFVTAKVEGGTIRKNTKICDRDLDNLSACAEKALAEWENVINSVVGESQPDYFARKACTLLSAFAEGCRDPLPQHCQVKLDWRYIYEPLMKMIGSVEEFQYWDETKCPAITKFKERMRLEEESGGSNSVSYSFTLWTILLLSIWFV